MKIKFVLPLSFPLLLNGFAYSYSCKYNVKSRIGYRCYMKADDSFDSKKVLVSTIAALSITINPILEIFQVAAAPEETTSFDLKNILGQTKYEPDVLNKDGKTPKVISSNEEKSVKVETKPVEKSEIKSPEKPRKLSPYEMKVAKAKEEKEKAELKAQQEKIEVEENARKAAELESLKASINSARIRGQKLNAFSNPLDPDNTKTPPPKLLKEEIEYEKINKKISDQKTSISQLITQVRETRKKIIPIEKNIMDNETLLENLQNQKSQSTDKFELNLTQRKISETEKNIKKSLDEQKKLTRELIAKENNLEAKEEELKSLYKAQSKASKVAKNKRAAVNKAEANAKAKKLKEERERQEKKKQAEKKATEKKLKAARIDKEAKEKALKVKKAEFEKAEKEKARLIKEEEKEIARLEKEKAQFEKEKADREKKEEAIKAQLEKIKVKKQEFDLSKKKEIEEAEARAKAALEKTKLAEQEFKQVSK